jgi:hypothetical protein
MKNKITTLAILTLMIGAAAAQNEPQTTGGPLDQLLRALQNVTESSRENSKTVQDLPGVIEYNFRQNLSRILVGNAVLMVTLYCIIGLMDRIRKNKNRLTHEEYITELEQKLVKRDGIIMDMIEKNNNDIAAIIFQIHANPGLLPHKGDKEAIKNLINGFGIGVLLMVVIHIMGGI